MVVWEGTSSSSIPRQKYVPTKTRKAVELISETIQERKYYCAKKHCHDLTAWKNILATDYTDRITEEMRGWLPDGVESIDDLIQDQIQERLGRKDLPDGDPSMDALVTHRSAKIKVELTLELLCAIRDCVA